MTLIIASILGFLTGGIATFLLLQVKMRQQATPSKQVLATNSTSPPVVTPSSPTAQFTPDKVVSGPAIEPTPTFTPEQEPTVVVKTPSTVPSLAEVMPVVAVNPYPRHYLNPDIELLSYRILSWGNSGKAVYIPQLIGYIQHPNHQVRKAVAIALGKVATTGSLRSDEARTIIALGNLSRDPLSSVRESAVEALGTVRSERVIPLLQQAQRDPDQDVVRIASVALQKFKYYPVRPAPKPVGSLRKR